MAVSAAADVLYVVAIGASAGGLDSMLSLFSGLESHGKAVYVVAQHMAHDAHSELIVRLLNRESALPVVLAELEQKLQADTIYLIPAGKNGRIEGQYLLLQPPDVSSLSVPSANVLFDSLAQAARQQGIGIVLSGTGRDGAQGCLAIKAAGGLTIAEMPESAKFNGMPRSAIESRAVDMILNCQGIAEHLNGLFGAASLCKALPAERSLAAGLNVADDDSLAKLLDLLFEETAIDFRGYKEETLLRRLDKHMASLGFAGIKDYLAYVRRHPDELHVLQHLFLVSLSSFFRDSDAFVRLKKALAELIAGKASGQAINIWVPACAGGEEALTLAVMLAEILGERLADFEINITGSDINSEALQIAKRGLYRQTAFREMPPGLLQRYFVDRGQHYQVAEFLQGLCRFERSNVLQPPSLFDLDLISCRNLLIYLKSASQAQIVRSFHQALRPGGLLFVGQAESIGMAGNTLFYPVDHYHKIYRRKA